MRVDERRVRALRGPMLVVLLGFPLQSGCDSELPRPRYAQQKSSALSQVGYPAPPARVEFIPRRPRRGVVWLDGEWAWSGSEWAWQAGRWVIPPEGATFSPWTTVRDERGTVYFASGVWNDAAGHTIPPPRALARGQASAGDVVSPEGDTEKAGGPTDTPLAGARP
jgi:hypothetical protein